MGDRMKKHTIRMTDEEYEEIAAYAAKNRRSFANFVVYAALGEKRRQTARQRAKRRVPTGRTSLLGENNGGPRCKR